MLGAASSLDAEGGAQQIAGRRSLYRCAFAVHCFPNIRPNLLEISGADTCMRSFSTGNLIINTPTALYQCQVRLARSFWIARAFFPDVCLRCSRTLLPGAGKTTAAPLFDL